MVVSVEIPDDLAKHINLNDVGQSRVLLKAFLLQRYATGELTARQVGAALGLSFSETEQFLFEHDAPAGLGPDEHARGAANLQRALER